MTIDKCSTYQKNSKKSKRQLRSCLLSIGLGHAMDFQSCIGGISDIADALDLQSLGLCQRRKEARRYQRAFSFVENTATPGKANGASARFPEEESSLAQNFNVRPKIQMQKLEQDLNVCLAAPKT